MSSTSCIPHLLQQPTKASFPLAPPPASARSWRRWRPSYEIQPAPAPICLHTALFVHCRAKLHRTPRNRPHGKGRRSTSCHKTAPHISSPTPSCLTPSSRQQRRSCALLSAADVPLDPAVNRTLAKQLAPAARWYDRVLPLSRTLPLIRPFIYSQWRLVLKAWVCTVVSVVALFLFVPQIGHLSNILSQGDLQNLFKKCFWVLILLAVRSVAQFWQQTLLWEASLNVAYDVRSYVFERVLARDMGCFEGRGGTSSGDIAYRITSEAEDTGDTVYALLQTLVPSVLQLAAMSARMVLLSPLLSVATISVVPCMSVLIAILGERLKQLSRKGQDSTAALSSYLNQVLPSMLLVKAHAAEDFEQWRFEMLAKTDCESHLKKKIMKAFIPEAITAVYATTAVVLFAVGTWTISCGAFSGAGMVAFVTSLVLLVEPIQALGKSYNELKQGEPAIERLFELTTVCPKVVEKVGALSLPSLRGDVKFCDVTFGYGELLPNVLTNVTLHVCAGETIALVGPSGGGKTTLAKLLLRLYDPVGGCILVDDHDVRDLSLKSLRQHVTIVPQEVALFSGTVAENIAYGVMPDAIEMKEVERAALLANAKDFIQKLPSGFSTDLGDRALCLSGGQRQRLAIARAIYHESSILILDEATSALDNISEKLVRGALEWLMAERTVFVIAHRLETIQKADRIFLLDGGRILEEGTHSSLLARGGHYTSLYTRLESKTG